MDHWTSCCLVSGTLAAVLLLAMLTSPHILPVQLARLANWLTRLRLGVARRYSHCGGYRFCYNSRGTPGGATPSMLGLHGFSYSKDSFLPLLKYLPKSQHVVCVDLPAHGGTSRTGAEDYSIVGQVQRVRQFVQSVGLDKRPFHLFGSSMGGVVAGVYAARYPSDVASLTLICPGGVVAPTETPFTTLLQRLETRQLEDSSPLSASAMKQLLKETQLGWQDLEGLSDICLDQTNVYREVLLATTRDGCSHKLQDHLHLIGAPVQLIWGKKDKVVHVSGVEVIQAALPSCRVHLLDCDHTADIEVPEESARLLMDFMCALRERGDCNAKKLS